MIRQLRAHALGAMFLTLVLTGLPPEAPVADAAQRGDLEAVRTLVRQGADVNAAQGDGMTALHWAAGNGAVDLIDVLLYAGANPEATTRLGGYTALHLAAQAGHGAALVRLLEGGADISSRTSTGITALHYAAAAGRPDAVTALLNAGADPDEVTTDDLQTALMWATAGHRLEAMRVLLDAGADVGLTSRTVDYVALAAGDRPARQRRDAVLRAQRGEEREATPGAGANRAPPSPQSRPAPPAEDSAAARGVAPAQDRAQAPGRNPDPAAAPASEEEQPLSYDQLVGKEGGFAALHFAARAGFIDASDMLLAAGADLDQPTADGTSPLLMATINGNFDLAMRFLAAGADPNQVAEDGAAPLFMVLNRRWGPKAAYPQPQMFTQQETDYLDLMRALLDAGADVNHRTGRHIWYTSFNFDQLGVQFAGATAFWRAAYATDVPAMKLLVSAGADPSIPTRKVPTRRFGGGEPSEDPSGLPEVPVGGPGVYPIQAASGVGYGEGFAANSHSHAPDSWLAAVRYLVEELGADVNTRDLNGYSAVHHAAARGDNELILYLVSKGADVMVVSRRGETTVDMANGPRQRVQPFPETIALLEGMGAKNNHKCQSC